MVGDLVTKQSNDAAERKIIHLGPRRPGAWDGNLLPEGTDSAREGVVVECATKDMATKKISATQGCVNGELWSRGVVFPGVLASWR